jgi:hypothetical protein
MYRQCSKYQGAVAMKDKKEDWEFEATVRLNMRVPPEFWRTVDEWRRRQPDLPNRSEAIRRLVELGSKVKPPK